MNKAFLIGRLTRDPELRTTSGSGVSVCTFTIAIDRRFTAADGKKEADFIPIVTWRGLADNCAKYLRKGSLAGVTGSIQTRSFDGKDGQKKYVTEVVADEVEFLSRNENSGRDSGYVPPPESPFGDVSPVEDDIPF